MLLYSGYTKCEKLKKNVKKFKKIQDKCQVNGKISMWDLNP